MWVFMSFWVHYWRLTSRMGKRGVVGAIIAIGSLDSPLSRRPTHSAIHVHCTCLIIQETLFYSVINQNIRFKVYLQVLCLVFTLKDVNKRVCSSMYKIYLPWRIIKLSAIYYIKNGSRYFVCVHISLKSNTSSQVTTHPLPVSLLTIRP